MNFPNFGGISVKVGRISESIDFMQYWPQEWKITTEFQMNRSGKSKYSRN